jgi:hypothetical protein
MLGPLALRYVATRLDNLYDLAFLIKDRRGSNLNDDFLAVLIEMLVGDHRRRLIGEDLRQRALFAQFFARYIATVEDYMTGQASSHSVLVFHHFPGGPICQHNPAIPVDDNQRLGNRF